MVGVNTDTVIEAIRFFESLLEETQEEVFHCVKKVRLAKWRQMLVNKETRWWNFTLRWHAYKRETKARRKLSSMVKLIIQYEQIINDLEDRSYSSAMKHLNQELISGWIRAFCALRLLEPLSLGDLLRIKQKRY